MKYVTIQVSTLLAMVLSAILLKSFTYAVPVPLLQVTELYQQSDIVAVGQIQAISTQEITDIDWHGSRIKGRWMRAGLLVDKPIKGNAQPASLLSFGFFQPDEFLGFRSVSHGQYGMFFLKRSSSNVISVTSPYYPHITALPDAIQTTETGLARVAQELALVLRSLKVTSAEKIATIRAMETINLPSVNILLKDSFQTARGQLKLHLASALLKRGDTSVLEYAVTALSNQSQSLDQNQLLQLALAIESGIHDPGSLPQLVRLLKTKDAPVRRAIAEAIRSTKSQAAIDPLTSLLIDTDAEVRYVAVIGLAEITGQYEWGPAQDVFQSNEQHFLDHWKVWSKSRQK